MAYKIKNLIKWKIKSYKKPNKIFTWYALLACALIAALLLILTLPYLGFVIIEGKEFSKNVTVDWTVSNVTAHVNFGTWKPTDCKEGIAIVADNMSIPFDVTNVSYLWGRCLATDIVWQNIIWQPGLQIAFLEPNNNAIIAQDWTAVSATTSVPAELVLLEWTFNNITQLEPMAGWSESWSYKLTNLAEGNYMIRAIATDSLNRTTASDPMYFTINYATILPGQGAARSAVTVIWPNITYEILWGQPIGEFQPIIANNSNISAKYNKTAPMSKHIRNSTVKPGFDWEATGELQNAYFEDLFGSGNGVEFDLTPTAKSLQFEVTASTVAINWQFKSMTWSDAAGKQSMMGSAAHVPAEITDRTVRYANVLAGIDFNYIYLPGTLKENITIANASVLSSPGKQLDDTMSLDFEFKLDHTPNLNIIIDGNSWDYNSEIITDQPIHFRKGSSNVAFFTKPFAVDAAGNTINAKYRLKNAGNEIFITIETPFEWLNDSAREWPVTIDPTMSSELWNVSDVMAIAVSSSSSADALGGAGANATIVLGEPAIGTSITGAYSACLGWFCTSYDTTKPIVGTPSFNTSTPTKINSSIQVNATWSDDLGVESCSYRIDTGSWNAMTLYNNTPSYLSGNASAVIAGPLADGSYNITVRCTDTSKNTGTNNATLTIDTVLPSITYVNPTDANSAIVDRNWTYVNVTVNGTGTNVGTCLLEWNATTNYTMNKVGSSEFVSCWYNKTDLADGAYTYKVFANDSAGNLNNSATRSITIAAVAQPPTITAPKCYELTGEWFNASALNITLAGGTTKTVLCNTTITDSNGASTLDFSSSTGVFYHAPTVNQTCSSDTRRCYINTTCANTTISSTDQVLTCYFDLWYHADNTTTSGNWSAWMNISDNTNNVASNTSTDLLIVEVLKAIDVSAVIDFGSVGPGNTSLADVNVTVKNYGNVAFNLQLNGTTLGGIQCTGPGAPLPATTMRYNCTNYNQDYSTAMKSLTANLADADCSLNLNYNDTAAGPPNATSTNLPWKIQVPQGTSGNCSSTVWFVATA